MKNQISHQDNEVWIFVIFSSMKIFLSAHLTSYSELMKVIIKENSSCALYE